MRFRFRRYVMAGGRCPVDEALAEIALMDDWLHTLMLGAFPKLREKQNHHPPLAKNLAPWQFYELRAKGTRIFWMYRPEQLIVFLGGENGKDQRTLPTRVFKRIDGYRLDYLDRCKDEETSDQDEEF